MDTKSWGAVARAIAEQTKKAAEVVAVEPCGGGCIHDTCLLKLTDGRAYIVKSSAAAQPGAFEREAEGLSVLAAAGHLRVPEVIAVGSSHDGIEAFLVLECIQRGPETSGFLQRFGRALACLHRDATQRRFGFDHDNYLGPTLQRNRWDTDWIDFFRVQRLGYQLDLARRRGLIDAELSRLGDRLCQRLATLLAAPADPPSLLHGDLWSGNYLSDEAGQPVLIDPAAYYGRREADLAMTELFGGFGADFYAAYNEIWPLEEGAEERMDIYKLYHLLNHLNIFGASYRPACLAILRRYAG